MCNIGKPVEIVVVDPLVLPAPLPGTPDAEPEPRPIAPSYIPVPIEVEEDSMFDEQTAFIPAI